MGFDHVAGSARSISIFKKIQNSIVLIKKQKPTGWNWVFDRVLPGHQVNPTGRPGHTGSWLFLFFHQSDPIPAPSQPDQVSNYTIQDVIANPIGMQLMTRVVQPFNPKIPNERWTSLLAFSMNTITTLKQEHKVLFTIKL